MEKSFSATRSSLKEIRLFLKNFLKKQKIDEKMIKQLELCVDEAASNIIKHSYKLENSKNTIKISIKFENHIITINLFDNGTPINKINIKPRKLKDIKPGGLGTFFINEIMDEVSWKTSKNWVNHLTLLKKI